MVTDTSSGKLALSLIPEISVPHVGPPAPLASGLHATNKGLQKSRVSDHVTVDRWQFTLTVMFHYLFPILTMGLSLFMLWLVTVSILGGEGRRSPALRKSRRQRDAHERAAQFWAKIFAVNFAVGVVTG